MNPQIITLNGKTPRIHESAWIAPGAVVAGDIEIGPEVGIWYGAVLRSEYVPMKIGARTSIQDNAVLHTNPFMPIDLLTIGEEVTVGHGAILHHCLIGDRALVGMGSIILDGARVGRDSVVAAGALVGMGFQIPPASLVVGNPGKVRREVTPEELAAFARGMRWYLDIKNLHREQRMQLDFDSRRYEAV